MDFQYSLPFEEEQEEGLLGENVVRAHLSTPVLLQDILPEYELFSRIKIADLYGVEWIEESLLNALVKNEIEYLTDFLKLKDTSMPHLKGVGGKRAAQLSLWKKQIMSEPYPYINFYKEYLSVHVLPEHEEKGEMRGGDVLLLFVRQYIAYLKRCHSEELAQMVSLYLGLDGEPQQLKQIAGQFSLSAERVRQKLAEVSEDWIHLYQGETIGNIQASDEWKETIGFLYTCLYRPIPFYLMQAFRLSEVTSEEDTVRRFSDLLGFFQVDLLTENYSEQQKIYLIVGKNEKGVYRRAVSFLISVMRTSPFWLSWDTIMEEFAKREYDGDLSAELLRTVLSYNPCFEKTEDDYFRLKWPFLGSMQLEVRRILVNARRPLYRKELLDIYNSYSRLYGCDCITDNQLIIFSDTHFVTQQKSGLWTYSPNGEEKEDVRMFMSSYLLSHGGKINIDDLFQVVSNAGYQYSDETIRAYLSVFCRVGLHDKNLFIHKDCISLYPDIPLRKVIVKQKKRSSPAYYSQIVQRAMELLEQQSSRQAPLHTVSSQCEELIPAELNKNVLYKILRTSEHLEIFIDEASGKKWIRLH